MGLDNVTPGDIDPLPSSVECPWCGAMDTRLEAPFGGILSVAQYYCNRCRTVFEWMKWQAPPRSEAGPSHD